MQHGVIPHGAGPSVWGWVGWCHCALPEIVFSEAVVFSTISAGVFLCLVLALDLKEKIKSKLLSTGEAARGVFSERLLVY